MCIRDRLYLDFKITKGKKSYTIPSVKIADGVIATSELPTAASSNASYAVSYTHLAAKPYRTNRQTSAVSTIINKLPAQQPAAEITHDDRRKNYD